jgi:sec-independent protein translocase protein TatB
MFGVGWTEMLVIGVVALIVIGPKDLPVVMSRLGKMVSTIRRLGSEFQSEINKTTGLDQITDLRRSITEPLKSVASEITRDFNRVTSTGTVEPTGIIAPKTAGAESVVAEIHEKIGTVAPAAHVESPAPAEAIAPVSEAAPAPKPRKPRAKATSTKAVAAAKAAKPVETSAIVATKPAAPRKPRARKAKADS